MVSDTSVLKHGRTGRRSNNREREGGNKETEKWSREWGMRGGGGGGGRDFPQTDMEKTETEKQSELVKVPSQQKV